jgi:hypothetical protein
MSGPIFECRKRGGARLIVQLREFGGSHFIDFREWVDDGGDLRATKKGCTMPPDLASELGEALLAMASPAAA